MPWADQGQLGTTGLALDQAVSSLQAPQPSSGAIARSSATWAAFEPFEIEERRIANTSTHSSTNAREPFHEQRAKGKGPGRLRQGE